MRTDRPADILADVLMLLEVPETGTPGDHEALKGLAESLGNEIALGVGRPLLPMPRARLAVEVTNPALFHRSLLTLLKSLDTNGRLRVEHSQVRGRDVIRFDHPATSLPIAVGIVRDQAVFTVGQAALEEAWEQAARGESLAMNRDFQAALPAKSGTHASLVVYHQTGEQGGDVEALLQLVGAPQPRAGSTMAHAPALLYAVAGEDQIDLYGDGIRNNWDVGKMLTSGAGLAAVAE
jgi:hypothetical protein